MSPPLLRRVRSVAQETATRAAADLTCTSRRFVLTILCQQQLHFNMYYTFLFLNYPSHIHPTVGVSASCVSLAIFQVIILCCCFAQFFHPVTLEFLRLQTRASTLSVCHLRQHFLHIFCPQFLFAALPPSRMNAIDHIPIVWERDRRLPPCSRCDLLLFRSSSNSGTSIPPLRFKITVKRAAERPSLIGEGRSPCYICARLGVVWRCILWLRSSGRH